MGYAHVIFDIDGTMLDTETADMLATQETLFQLTGEKKNIDEFRFTFGIPNSVAFPRLGVDDVEKASLVWAENYGKYQSSLRLFDGIEELLGELRKEGCTLGIVTSKSRREYKADFATFGLDGYFNTIICVDDSTRPKPHPDPVLEYLKRTKASRAETIYIGDTSYDAQCAYAAGIDFGLATWGAHDWNEIKADYYLRTPAEVLELAGNVSGLPNRLK